MNKTETKRINAYVASSSELSRRASDEAIINKRVRINGRIAVLGDRVGVNDVVTLDSKTIEMIERHVVYALNKPKGYVCTNIDKHAKHLAVSLIKEADQMFLHSIGRLDKDSEGLILFTNNGYLTKQITHPKSEVEKEYYVKAQRRISEKDIRVLKEGITDNGEFLHVKSIEQMSPTESLIVLNEGKNREIRRLFNHIGNEVESLVRIRIGGYTLPPTLKSGMYKKLHDSDIARILGTSEGNKA